MKNSCNKKESAATRTELHLAVTLDKTDTTLNQGFHQDSYPPGCADVGIYAVPAFDSGVISNNIIL